MAAAIKQTDCGGRLVSRPGHPLSVGGVTVWPMQCTRCDGESLVSYSILVCPLPRRVAS
jgi:hypothetical protein